MDISTPYLVLKAYNEPLWDSNDVKFEIWILQLIFKQQQLFKSDLASCVCPAHISL